MVYIALLRGINVGGNNKIEMKKLKQTFENVGMKDVVTYINTGNIIFKNLNRSKAQIINDLEQAILTDFGLNIRVLVLTFEDFQAVTQTIPEHWTNDQSMKSDVMFLWEEYNEAAVVEQLIIKPGIDTALYVPGAVIWSVDKAELNKSGMQKLIGSKLYKNMTIRNVNTTRKIYELMLQFNHS